MKKSKIKAIAFDVGGVLELDSHGKDGARSVHGYVAKKLKVDLDTYFDVIGAFHNKAIDGEVTRARMMKVMTDDFKTSSEKLQRYYKKGFNRVFKSNKKLYGYANKLKKAGYKIGILSDQWYLSRDALIKPKRIKNFDFVVISCDDKARKPGKKIYKIALKRAKVKASEMAFIDNREWNVQGAEKLGIHGILFEDNGKCIRDLEGLGVGI
jgi:epoxide hydrolase-like predicted phosphatase